MSLLPSVEDSLPGFASCKSLQRDRDEAAPFPSEAASKVCLPVKTQTQLSQGPGAPFVTPPPSPDRTSGNRARTVSLEQEWGFYCQICL